MTTSVEISATTLGFNVNYDEVAPTGEEISALSGFALLEFGTSWCGHCQAAQGVLESVMQDYPEMPHIKVFDGKGKHLGREYKVKLWPTLILLIDGEEIDRIVRFTSEDDVIGLLKKVAM